MTPELPPPSGPPDPLAPLLSTLIGRSRRDAAETLERADEDAASTLRLAREQADALLAQARARGAADADAVLATERARAQREARAVLLAAQRAAHETARRAALDAVSGLRDDPAYPLLIDVLRARAQRDLGPGATIAELARGGIVAEADGRRLEYSLDGLAEDVLDRLAGDRAELWSE